MSKKSGKSQTKKSNQKKSIPDTQENNTLLQVEAARATIWSVPLQVIGIAVGILSLLIAYLTLVDGRSQQSPEALFNAIATEKSSLNATSEVLMTQLANTPNQTGENTIATQTALSLALANARATNVMLSTQVAQIGSTPDAPRVAIGPWSKENQSMTLTINQVEVIGTFANKKLLRFSVTVWNMGFVNLFLPLYGGIFDSFFATDKEGNKYRADPVSSDWHDTIQPGVRETGLIVLSSLIPESVSTMSVSLNGNLVDGVRIP